MVEKLIQTLKDERTKFNGVVEQAKKRKSKMLNPIFSQKVVCSIGVVAYIDTLIERLEKGEFN
jgi:hypothetical protein